MDAAQWQQVGFSMSMEEIIANNNTGRAPQPQQQQQQQLVMLDSNNNNSQRRSRPEKEQNINCPRCNSTNTKFCYYNNYSLTQPRYFCKTCRRYWTQGGSLRNVPVGGGSRKNKRSTPSSSSPISPSSSPAISSLSSSIASPISSPNPPTTTLSHLIPPHKTHHHYQDLNLAFPTSTATQDLHAALLQPMEMPKIELGSCFRSSYVPVPMPHPNGSSVLYPSSGFPNPQEVKPGLMGFPGPADGLGLGPRFNIGSLQENNTSNSGDGASARLLFPFGDINKFPSHHNATTTSATSSQDHHHQGASGYWSGMLGGGTW